MQKDRMLVPFEVKSIEVKEDEGSGYAYVNGYASIYNNIDLGGDRVLSGAFADDLKENGNERPALWYHNPREPVGVKFYEEDMNGLKFIARLPMVDSFVRERLLPQLEVGSVKGVSIGYYTIEDKYNAADKCRDLVKLGLMESSFVVFAMNPKAMVLSVEKSMEHIDDFSRPVKEQLMSYVKASDVSLMTTDSKAVPPFRNLKVADSGTEWDGRKAVAQAREATGSSDAPTSQYKSHFFYYDQDNAEDFGAYKLPKAMLVDGEFKYVPKGIAAVVGAISGARGGLDIPAADKEKIKGQVNRIYRMMGREEPFKSKGLTLLDVETIKGIEPIDFEHCLKAENIVLSSKACEFIAGVVSGKGEPGSDQGEGDSDFMAELKRMKKTIKEL